MFEFTPVSTFMLFVISSAISLQDAFWCVDTFSPHTAVRGQTHLWGAKPTKQSKCIHTLCDFIPCSHLILGDSALFSVMDTFESWADRTGCLDILALATSLPWV